MFSRPENVVDHFKTLLQANQAALGLGFVGAYDEKLVPKYPAVVISPGQLSKTLHATHTFAIILRCFFWVYHGELSKTYNQRNLADLQLATQLVSLIENDMTLGGNIIQGWVETETPGVVQSRSVKTSAIVGTRLNWEGVSQSRFS